MGVSRVFFDTNLIIYLVERIEPYHGPVIGIVRRMRERDDELVTSTLTLGEVLVRPRATKDGGLSARYEELLREGARLVAFDAEAAQSYADIRQDRAIKPADAIQLACAAAAKVDLFITNDERLSRKIVPGVQFIASLSQAHL